MKTKNYFRFSNFSQLLTVILSIVLTITFSAAAFAQTQLDTSFNAGVSEEQALVYVSAPLPDGKVLVGGSFRLVNGVQRSGLVRLNSDGTLDESFNPGGSGANASVYEIIMLPDGKFLVGGSFSTYNDTAIRGLVRLNADGTLDTTFNSSGTGTNSAVQGISLQSDGKILISGSSISSYNGVANKFSVVRVNSDGTLDTTFNSPFTTAAFVEEVDVQADGKIMVGGSFTVGSPSRTNIVRLNADGSLDSTFNPTGGGADGGVYAMTLQADGKILIGGDFTNYNFNFRRGIARLNADGSLDSSFVPPNFLYSVGEYFTLQPDGKILIAGSFSYGFPNTFQVLRLNSDGSIDNGFQANSADNYGYNVKLQANGQIILTGYFNNFAGQTHNGIVRLNSDGTVDNSFNGSFFNFGTISVIAQQPDGKVLVGGLFRRAGGSVNVNIARFNPDGTLDTSFNTGSGADPNGFDFFNTVSAIAVQSDGKILVGGRFSGFNRTSSPGIVRLNADGSIDTSFINYLDPNSPNNVNDITILPDNRILIGGSYLVYNNQFKFMLRLYSNGTVDNTFNLNNAGPNSNINRIVRQPDGRILIGGSFTIYNGISRNRIARLNADGSLDVSFNPGTGANASLFDVVLQSDGRILIGGNFTTINGGSQNRIARLNSGGSLDSSFNAGAGANGIVYSIALEPSGKIFIGGNFSIFNGFNNRLARLNPDGSLDTSFVSGISGDSVSSVRKLLFQSDGKLLLGGTFTSYFGTPQSSLARLVTFATVAGRITNTKGAGVAGATVTLTNANGVTRTVIADNLGYYQFGNVEAFQNYVIGVSAKRHRFNPSSKTITVNGNLSNVNFVALRGS